MDLTINEQHPCTIAQARRAFPYNYAACPIFQSLNLKKNLEKP